MEVLWWMKRRTVFENKQVEERIFSREIFMKIILISHHFGLLSLSNSIFPSKFNCVTTLVHGQKSVDLKKKKKTNKKKIQLLWDMA
jgi:hypothetical protein